MKYFEKELPDGYQEVLTLDPKSKKGRRISLIGLAIIVIGLALAILLIGVRKIFDAIGAMPRGQMWLVILIYFVMLFLYIIVHELIHGLFYKIFTHQKLKFGTNGKVAYCGVPGIYVYHHAIMLILIAPCVVLTTAFLIPIILISNALIRFLLAVLLVIQFAGCIYDLYDFFVLLFKYRNKKTLIYDDGPVQKFYVPSEEAK